MNVAAHPEKEKNVETKTGKRKAGEKELLLHCCGRSGGSMVKKWFA